MSIDKVGIPEDSLLNKYASNPSNFSDCYSTSIDNSVTLQTYIAAFYNSLAFLPERMLLGLVAGRPADERSVAGLAAGNSKEFSAWSVEDRQDNQILLCDMREATRSWLMVEPLSDKRTRLYFGSAVVLANDKPAPYTILTTDTLSQDLLGAAAAGLN